MERSIVKVAMTRPLNLAEDAEDAEDDEEEKLSCSLFTQVNLKSVCCGRMCRYVRADILSG